MNLLSAPKRAMKPRFKNVVHSRRLHSTEVNSCTQRKIRSSVLAFTIFLAVLSSLIVAHTFTNRLLDSYYAEELAGASLFSSEQRKLQQKSPSSLRSNSMDGTIAKLSRQQTKQKERVSYIPTTTRRSVVSNPTPVASRKKEIAWLMSFPNSGTSFTIHMTRESSNCTTATNYALEGEIKDKPSTPAIPSNEGLNGPWLELIPGRHTTVPQTLLTKTHCAGFCTDPMCRSVHTARSFMMGCLSGTKAVETENGDLEKIHVSYNKTMVKKAIHLFRHPLDNIVARFHLVYNTRKAQGDVAFTTAFPKNHQGFHRWCAEEDTNKRLFESLFLDHPLRDALKRIPCRNDFFRFVQWHNLAFTTTRDLDIPTMLLHYDEYSADLNRARDRVLNFLDLPRVGEAIEFHPGKEYRDYYSDEQKVNILAFIKEFASSETWNQLKGYAFGIGDNLVAVA